MSHSEWQWIADLRRRTPALARAPIGIGDDAALLETGGQILVSTDMLMDGVDFVVGQTPPELIGRKCLAVNLSDIAAMAGRPHAAVVSLALPGNGGRQLAERLYSGLLEIASEFDCAIIGGDTNSWDGPLVVSVTILGQPTGRGAVQRNGARAGDSLFVTGPLGGSLPSSRHCTFRPRVSEAQALHQAVKLHALIDLSDGLASDLFHIAEASDLGIELDAGAIPIHSDVPADLAPSERLRHALTDGEDFELLFCVGEDDAARLESAPPPGVNVFRIGRCVSRPGVWLVSGDSIAPLSRGGWEHQFG
jgi:thiamine-monophosphate kinase